MPRLRYHHGQEHWRILCPMYTFSGETNMFADETQKPELTPVIIDVLALHITEYLTAYITQEMMADTDGTLFDMDTFPYLLIHMLEEPMDGCISGGFIGYLLGKQLPVKKICGNVPRAQALATLQILEKHKHRPEVQTYIDNCKAAQEEYEKELNKEIPDNVTPILH